VYANGSVLGGVGGFSGATPTAYGNHYPRLFPLPPDLVHGGPVLLAIRVWAGPWTGTGGGGMHVAPVIGAQDAVTAQYRLQWLKIFEGYAVDAVPALLFFLMAVLVLCLRPFEPRDRTPLWLAAALTLSGIQRGNQPFFFWWQIETVQGFVYFILAFTASLSLGAWMIAWRGWLRLDGSAWFPKAVAVLTGLLILTQLLGRPWLFGGTFPPFVADTVHYLIMALRLAFLLVFGWTIYQAARLGREGWIALPAMLSIGVVLFAQELSLIHVPGIWFPFGVGLSLSECASVVFDLLLFALLVRRLHRLRGGVGVPQAA